MTFNASYIACWFGQYNRVLVGDGVVVNIVNSMGLGNLLVGNQVTINIFGAGVYLFFSFILYLPI
jgi:hypothetical protein